MLEQGGIKKTMSELKSEKEMVSPQAELLKSTKELNDTIRDILENGTLEQKVELLVSDYKQRMANEEFQKQQELQSSLLSYRLGIMGTMQVPVIPKL